MNVRFLLIRKLKLPTPFWPSGPISKRRKAVVFNPQSRRSSRIQSVAVPRRIGVPNTLFNNQRWQAVRRATVGLAREGFAAKINYPINGLPSGSRPVGFVRNRREHFVGIAKLGRYFEHFRMMQ